MLFYVLSPMPLARRTLEGAHWAVGVGEKVVSEIHPGLERCATFHASVEEGASAVQTWRVVDWDGVCMVLLDQVVL